MSEPALIFPLKTFDIVLLSLFLSSIFSLAHMHVLVAADKQLLTYLQFLYVDKMLKCV